MIMGNVSPSLRRRYWLSSSTTTDAAKPKRVVNASSETDDVYRRRLADALIVREDIARLYEGILPDMQRFYDTEGKYLPDPELMTALDQRFGRELIAHVCEPAGLFDGACVFVAAILLRQGMGRLV